MSTTLYLLRHGATAANLASPPPLQGRSDLPLAPLGILQAEAARDLLATHSFQACYCSPLLRAAQTAEIVAAPHGLSPQSLEALVECAMGRWEGLDWQTIRARDPEAVQRFQLDPAENRYPGGESFADVHRRAAPALEALVSRHPGESLLVVAHHGVLRVYLADLLGLPRSKAREVCLDNGSVSVVLRRGADTDILSLNATAHLRHLPP